MCVFCVLLGQFICVRVSYFVYLRNDLLCIEWDVTHSLTQLLMDDGGHLPSWICFPHFGQPTTTAMVGCIFRASGVIIRSNVT